MKVIDILSDDCHIKPLLKLDEKSVGMVRLHLQQTIATHVVELQHRLGILLKTSHTSKFLKVILTPYAVIRPSESRKPALYTYSCTCEDHKALARLARSQLGQLIVSVFHSVI
jgi:hypothetical protein